MRHAVRSWCHHVRVDFQFGRAGIAAALAAAHALLLLGLFTLARSPATEPTPATVVSFIAETPEAEEWEPQVVQAATTGVSLPIPVPTAPSIEVAPQPSPVPETITTQEVTAQPPADAAPSDAPRKVVEPVVYIREPVIRYPPQSWRLREQGQVLFEVVVDERGVPVQIKLERTSGYPRLDEAGREAISNARFRPYMENGVPRSVFVLVPLRFSLKRSN
jgi:periplasmic protein TonB